MCGIAGSARFDGLPVRRELVESMCRAQEHRGPDARGIHVGAGVGLGIQRLRVIDLATGDQPIYNEDRSVVVVLNGEIYNYAELRRRLRHSGHRFATDGDTEAIVHLYEELGERCVEELHGMFAFALWDERRRRLLVARDRVGKKPLFYAERDAPDQLCVGASGADAGPRDLAGARPRSDRRLPRARLRPCAAERFWRGAEADARLPAALRRGWPRDRALLEARLLAQAHGRTRGGARGAAPRRTPPRGAPPHDLRRADGSFPVGRDRLLRGCRSDGRGLARTRSRRSRSDSTTNVSTSSHEPG